MLGLALEGGGARGAYHVGAVKAYLENGYIFDGFVGTSIGSINAALLAQGDFEKTLELWQCLSSENIFDADEQTLFNIGEAKWDMGMISNLKIGLKKVLDDGGVDTSKIKGLVNEYIDEQKLRLSSKVFGLVTVSVSERKPYELFLEDIPQGEMLQYIMASACFPGFKPAIINEKTFIDGGLYNNCPINMLLKKQFDEIIAIRTLAPGFYRNVKIPDGVSLTTITPSEDLGNVMIFSQERIASNIQLGYFDGLRAIRNLHGQSYYINLVNPNDIESKLVSLDDNDILEVGNTLELPTMPAKRMLFEHVVPKIGAYLKLKKDFSYADFVVALLEHSAKNKGIERYQVYDYEDFLELVKEKPLKEEKTGLLAPIISKINFTQKHTTAIELMLDSIIR